MDCAYEDDTTRGFAAALGSFPVVLPKRNATATSLGLRCALYERHIQVEQLSDGSSASATSFPVTTSSTPSAPPSSTSHPPSTPSTSVNRPCMIWSEQRFWWRGSVILMRPFIAWLAHPGGLVAVATLVSAVVLSFVSVPSREAVAAIGVPISLTTAVEPAQVTSCGRMPWTGASQAPSDVLENLRHLGVGIDRAFFFRLSNEHDWRYYAKTSRNEVVPGSSRTSVLPGSEIWLGLNHCAVTVTAEPSDGSGGHVEIIGGTKTRDGQKIFTRGAQVIVLARTYSGWYFDRWEGGKSGSDATIDFKISHDLDIKAHWIRIDNQGGLFNKPRFAESLDQPIDGCPTWKGGTPENISGHNESARQEIVRILFGFKNLNDAKDCAKYAYHDYGSNLFHKNGHAGWDAKTTNANSKNIPFYSLTNGRVVDPPTFSDDSSPNPIAVDDGSKIILYYHASHRYVKFNDTVHIGQPIGVQGCVGLCSGAHVHIEVQSRPSRDGLPQNCGYKRCHRQGITHDPLDYLTRYLHARQWLAAE